MKKNKYLALLIVTVLLCSTLVACSSEESVYNEDVTENPPIEVIHAYSVAQGDFLDMISKAALADMPESKTPPAE